MSEIFDTSVIVELLGKCKQDSLADQYCTSERLRRIRNLCWAADAEDKAALCESIGVVNVEEEIMGRLVEPKYKIEFDNNKPAHQTRVEKFMIKAGQEIPDKPTVPSFETLRLRARLILEEVFELFDAMGILVTVDTASDSDLAELVVSYEKMHVYKDNRPVDMVKAADGLADSSVVLYGTASAMGINMGPILGAVDKNNLDKFSPGYSIREDGKLIKPPGHKPPDLEALLIKQGWRPHGPEGPTGDIGGCCGGPPGVKGVQGSCNSGDKQSDSDKSAT